jgi:NADH-quinone oxidoreductase subunit A
MVYAEYLPILIQVVLALGIGVGILIASHAFGQGPRTNSTKDSAYECGMISTGQAHAKFSVKFYVVAMLFIVFDIEAVFFIPWAMIYRDFLANDIPILLPILFFTSILIVGFIYEFKKGALDWEK